MRARTDCVNRRSEFFQGQAFAILLILAALIYPAILAARLNIWVDEAYSLHTTQAGAWYAFQQALRFENQAPLYFVLLSLWRQLDHSILFARWFSILCTGGLLASIVSIARRLLPDVPITLVLIVVAVNPFVIEAAVEIRLYAFVMLLSALLTLTFFLGYWLPNPRSEFQLWYVICAVASIYTQYYLAFLIFAQVIAMVRYRPPTIRNFLIGIGVVALLFIPMADIIRNQVHTAVFNTGAPASLLQNATQLTSVLTHYILPVALPPHSGGWVLLVLAAIAIGLIGVFRHSFRWEGWSIQVLILVATAAAMTAAVTIAAQTITERYAAALFVPTLLVVFGLFQAIDAGKTRAVSITWTAVVFAASVLTLAAHYRPDAKAGDWKRVSAYIMANERAGQPILVFEASQALPLAYYYSGKNVLVPIPSAITFDRYDVRRNVLHDAGQIEAALRRSSAGKSPPFLWLVTSDYCNWLEVDFHCEVLDDFVRRHYRQTMERNFFGSRARLLRSVPSGHKQ